MLEWRELVVGGRDEETPWWVVDLGYPMTVQFLLLTNHGANYCTYNTFQLSNNV